MSDKTHVEHNESALALITDVPRDMDFRCNGPLSDLTKPVAGVVDLMQALGRSGYRGGAQTIACGLKFCRAQSRPTRDT
jgi:hypothetical protein